MKLLKYIIMNQNMNNSLIHLLKLLKYPVRSDLDLDRISIKVSRSIIVSYRL
jgi:hypothetical protein